MAIEQLGNIYEIVRLPDGSILITTTDELAVNDTLEFIFEAPTETAPQGSCCYGHDTSVVEDNIIDFTNHWTGTGVISGSGDSEIITLDVGEYMESEDINFGAADCVISADKYQSPSGAPIIKYKTAATQAGLVSESWTVYSDPFTSLGWVKVRVEN